ncbi:phenylacetic acid degradation operon negative regulatory protein [Microbacterium resistens]|uniref:Phenylacetic acid degradation operon negative regulatory protein n=1 Tax=Microbacterium resistens TaxID=156977 RepID=A0ABU1SC66_9MICO|nr:PaaX family transcriptional regulator C-terminal domain-containing protein [Microbacterium resistens]MDR6867191.1 phenylacetic acid degradation operon negative regulatory protein [Microbacterium resistens]
MSGPLVDRGDGATGALLDDIDARPGSTASFLRTIIGLYLRRLDGWIATADLVRLMTDLGVPAARTRTALARVKRHGLLVPDRRDAIGYRLAASAEPMLARGDRRIFAVRQMTREEGWCLISFSVPESRRDLRHQLRRRLGWIGCGMVSAALWVCPDHLGDEAQEIVDELGAGPFATVFRGATPGADPSVAVQSWWDLDALRREHETFQAAIPSLLSTRAAEPGAAGATGTGKAGGGTLPIDDAAAFADYVRLIDAWRILPYVDPGLPAELLPADWPGTRSVAGFAELSARLDAPSWRHVQAVTNR